MRFLNKILLVDELAQKGAACFSFDLFPADDTDESVLILRFLNKAKGSEWLSTCNLLPKRLASSRVDEENVVRRYYLSFLKTCLDNPESVSSELEAHIPTDDVSWALWLQVLLGLPKQGRGRLLSVFLEKWHLVSGDRVRRELQQLAVDLLQGEKSNDTVRFLETILGFLPQPEQEVQDDLSRSDIFNQPEPAPRFSVHEYQELLEVLVNNSNIPSSLLMHTVLVATLHSAIELSIPDEEKSERRGEDGSTYWRPAIEAHEQNYDYGHRDQLVTAIRDISESILRQHPDAKAEIDSLLGKSEWIVFTRLRLHLCRKFPELFQTEIRAGLLDSELRDNSSIWHEWALLFSDQFKILKAEEQEVLLQWIERGDDLQPSIEFSKSAMPERTQVLNFKKGGRRTGSCGD
jgi:hypothetical protein